MFFSSWFVHHEERNCTICSSHFFIMMKETAQVLRHHPWVRWVGARWLGKILLGTSPQDRGVDHLRAVYEGVRDRVLRTVLGMRRKAVLVSRRVCRIQNSYFWILNSEFRIQNAEFWIQNSEFRIQNSEVRIQNYEVRIQNSKFRILNSEFWIHNS